MDAREIEKCIDEFGTDNCSVEQISTIIKKPPGTVKSRLFKGRSLIKKRLEEAGYEK